MTFPDDCILPPTCDNLSTYMKGDLTHILMRTGIRNIDIAPTPLVRVRIAFTTGLETRPRAPHSGHLDAPDPTYP